MTSACCGLMSLQKACIIIATIEILMAGVFLLIHSSILIVETPLAIKEMENAIAEPDPYKFHSIRIVLCGVNACYWVGCLFLGMILLSGAKQRDLKRLRAWYILTSILTVLFLLGIFMEVFSLMAPIIAILSPTFGTILNCYMIWIVTDFMDEVSKGGRAMLVKAEFDENI